MKKQGYSRWMEDEANQFALCLLMPEDLLRQEVAKVQFDFTDDAAFKHLANIFGVSHTALAVRLAQLKIFK